MNFVYSIIVNYQFALDRLDVYILYLKLAEGPRGANARLPPPPWLRHCNVIPCLSDAEGRVRYYAAESLYNVVKTTRAAALPFLPDIFDALAKVCHCALCTCIN